MRSSTSRTKGRVKTSRTFGEAARSYLARRGRVGKTSAEYIGRFVDEWGEEPLDRIDIDRVNDWVDDRLAAVSGPTVRRELAAAMTVLNHAAAGLRPLK